MAKKNKKMRPYDWVLIAFLLLAGLHMSLLGLFSVNLVNIITFNTLFLKKAVYVMVGIATVVSAARLGILAWRQATR